MRSRLPIWRSLRQDHDGDARRAEGTCQTATSRAFRSLSRFQPSIGASETDADLWQIDPVLSTLGYAVIDQPSRRDEGPTQSLQVP